MQTGFVAEGLLAVTVDGTTTGLAEGGASIVAPDLVPRVVALGKGLLIDGVTPCRDDLA